MTGQGTRYIGIDCGKKGCNDKEFFQRLIELIKYLKMEIIRDGFLAERVTLEEKILLNISGENDSCSPTPRLS